MVYNGWCVARGILPPSPRASTGRAAVRVWEELLRLAPNYRHAPEIHASLESIRKLLKKGGP